MVHNAHALGTILRGKYRVERVLGSGGMGVVLAATHLRLGGFVAIKMLQPEARERDEIVRRFAREARAASRLRGEHAVRILDVDESESGDPFLVMELLEGRDLQCILAEDGALPTAMAVEYLLQACEGVAEAHALGIVHRDLKPANLFVAKRPDQTPLVKILDFGISKAVNPESAESPEDFLVTRPAVAIGSPSYMSPEHLKNAADVDARTDVWSLGVVLYQLLANALPFVADTTAALAARIAADPPPSLRARQPNVPDALEAIVLRCLSKDRALRFSNVAELARALAAFGARGESSAERVARVLDAGAGVVVSSASVAPRDPGKASTLVPEVGGDAVVGVGTQTIVAGGSSTPSSSMSEATGAIHGPLVSPLAKAMSGGGTEYGSSTAVPTPTPDRPTRRATWIAGVGLLAIVGAGAAALFTTRGGTSTANVTASTTVTPSSSSSSASSLSSLASLASSAPITTPPSNSSGRAVAITASSTPIEASARHSSSLSIHVPTATVTTTHGKTTATVSPANSGQKNPMNIDFR